MMTFFHFPEKAIVNKNIPKTKFYEYANINKSIRNAFISQIQQIVWAYKLAPETINLAAINGFYEIQVFDIFLKGRELDEGVLFSIDKAIPHPIFYQLHYEAQVKACLSYKRHSDSNNDKWIVERYYSTAWVDELTVEKERLPVSFDLNGLYENLLKKMMAVEVSTRESIQDLNSRQVDIAQKQKEITLLEKRVKNEKQFNKKLELNNKLIELRSYLNSLTH